MASPISPARWWTEETVAVVTGSNKGKGLDIVRKLAQDGLKVVLAARDESRGLKSTQELHNEGLRNVVFHKLDISNLESMTEFADWIEQTFGGLDILVNNAAVQYLDNTFEHTAECTDINCYGTKNLTEKLLPNFRASSAGARILIDPSAFDEELINDLATGYKEVCRAGDMTAAAGYGNPYSFSKVLGNAYTRLLAQRVADRNPASTIYMNCVDPGTVDTGIWAKFRASVDHATVAELQKQGHLGAKPKTTAEGADSPDWLALYPPGGPSGRFWSDRKELNFVSGEAQLDQFEMY